MTPLRILHLEDSALDADLALTRLRRGGVDCQIRHVETREEFERALRESVHAAPGAEGEGEGGYDLILSDYALPGFDGAQALAMASEICPETPFIFVSAVLGEEIAIDTLKLGATDYVLKQRIDRLVPAVHRALAEAQERRRRRRAEEALRESEARFRSMADGAPVLIWLGDGAGTRVWFNRPWLEFTGLPLHEQTGEGWLRCVHTEDRSRVAGAACELAAGRPATVRYRLRRADGLLRWVLEQAVPLRMPDGAEAGCIGSCVDITELEEARSALQERSLGLEETVASRTRELEASHERLRLAERMAALGTLAAGVGHDIGNLLLPIRARLDALEAKGLEAELREDVKAIRESAGYLQRLANGLRLLSMDGAARTPAGEASDLHRWWGEVQGLLRHQLPRGIELSAEIPEGLPLVLMHPAALTQAAFNLVQNAGEVLRGRDGGRVTVRAAAESESIVVVSVSDNGPGMSEEVRRRCLEPFFTTKTRGISTGLGLALVHGIVQSAGGEVRVESSPDDGTTFALRLPASRRVARNRSPGPAPLALVSEGDARLGSLVARLLRTEGFEVVRAHGPPEDDVAVWVTAGGEGVAGEARRFVGDDARRRVIVLGDKPGSAAPHPQIAFIDGAPQVTTIRRAVREVAQACLGAGAEMLRDQTTDQSAVR